MQLKKNYFVTNINTIFDVNSISSFINLLHYLCFRHCCGSPIAVPYFKSLILQLKYASIILPKAAYSSKTPDKFYLLAEDR